MSVLSLSYIFCVFLFYAERFARCGIHVFGVNPFSTKLAKNQLAFSKTLLNRWKMKTTSMSGCLLKRLTELMYN